MSPSILHRSDKIRRSVYLTLLGFGIDLRRILSVPLLIRFIYDFLRFKRLSSGRVYIRPVVHDYKETAGTSKGHYFHQDLLVAQKIFLNAPTRHVDVGSRIDGFVAHVASFRKIEVIDIRPLEARSHENIQFLQMDITSDSCLEANITDSISSLHAIEHFGLGRYGDPLDPNGHLVGLRQIFMLLKPNGIAYISAPLGRKPGIYFNEQRIFSAQQLASIFTTLNMEIISFDYVNDEGDLFRDFPHSEFNCSDLYGCGIYTLRKLF